MATKAKCGKKVKPKKALLGGLLGGILGGGEKKSKYGSSVPKNCGGGKTKRKK